MAARAADGIEFVTTPERLAPWYRASAAFDPGRDALAAQLEGQIVAFARTRWFDGEVARVHESLCVVHPEVRRRGIGRALARAIERRVREQAAVDGAGRRRLLATKVAKADLGAHPLLESEGFRPVLHFDDTVLADLDRLDEPAPLPEGLVLMPVEPAHLRAIWDANIDAYRDAPGEDDWSDEAFARFVEDDRTDARHWQVAWDGHRVAALVMTWIDEEENRVNGYQRGWLWSVAVRPEWRGRGVARSLMLRSLAALRGAGMTSAGLDVIAENPTGAPQLYRSLGFAVTGTRIAYQKYLEASDDRPLQAAAVR